jgi:hypothetical protein
VALRDLLHRLAAAELAGLPGNVGQPRVVAGLGGRVLLRRLRRQGGSGPGGGEFLHQPGRVTAEPGTADRLVGPQDLLGAPLRLVERGGGRPPYVGEPALQEAP